MKKKTNLAMHMPFSLELTAPKQAPRANAPVLTVVPPVPAVKTVEPAVQAQVEAAIAALVAPRFNDEVVDRIEEIEHVIDFSQDHVITDADKIGWGTPKDKYKANVAAIRLLKKIESEHREATPQERAALVRYVGWGGLSLAFDTSSNYYENSQWSNERQELPTVMDKDEYDSAKASTPNAHYTSEAVIRAIYAGLEHLGFTGGHAVEPAAGVGHFIGLMPEAMRKKTKWTAIELDKISGRIAKKLYPSADVRIEGFEKSYLADNHYDLLVGNVPFGNYGIADPRYDKYQFSIHDYFFARGIDLVRPGGLLVFITSRYTMDKAVSKVRRYLMDRADLLGAIRLPNTAFKGNAGTEVVTDIIVLKKRDPKDAPAGKDWLETAAKNVQGDDISINGYFLGHQEMVCGTFVTKSTQYGRRDLSVNPDTTTPLHDQIVERFKMLPANVYVKPTRHVTTKARLTMTLPAPGDIKEHAFCIQNNNLYRKEGTSLVLQMLPSKTTERIKGIIKIRDAAREVLRVQLDGCDDATLQMAQQTLTQAYDNFVSRYGFLNTTANRRAFSGDPDVPFVLSLELWDSENEIAYKADIFSKRTLEIKKQAEKCNTAKDALTVSLNEFGTINWARMVQLTGKTEEDLYDELRGFVFFNPLGGWETAEQYLSGNVREKLRIAEDAALRDPAYLDNVDALQAIQPVNLRPDEIQVRLGAPWIPESDYTDFANHIMQSKSGGVEISWISSAGTWDVEASDFRIIHSVANTNIWGSKRMSALELLECGLNQQVPTVRDPHPTEDKKYVVNQAETLVVREKLENIQEEFRKWLWKDEIRRDRLVKLYNEKFNSTRLTVFDGSHLTLPGIASYVNGRLLVLRPHQLNGIWRIITSGNTLLAHVVGAGKTWTMVAAAMELRRLGMAKKPMIVVPNHLLDQWGREFLQLYPGANILVAGKEDFEKSRRNLLFSRIATGDWDAVIIGHSSFEKIAMSREAVEAFYGEQIEDLEEAIIDARASGETKRSRTVKELEKMKKRLEVRLEQKLGAHKKDNTLTFEEMGVDYLFVDEAHEFKNLAFATKMPRIAGLPNAEANKSFDMFMKTQYIVRKNNGRGVVFATGTPISNTLAEMFTMQRYLQMETLRDYGLATFDQWAASFAEAVTGLEVAPDGSGFRMNTRFSKFVNLPELLQMFRQVADVQTGSMVDLPIPKIEGGRAKVEAAEPSPLLKDYVQTLVERAERVRSGISPKIDNMLAITGDGRKAALDLRLINDQYPDDPNGKLNIMVKNALAIYHQFSYLKGAQLIFSDIGTPSADFNVYDEVKKKLVARGVPDTEIAFIHDADTDQKKADLFQRVREGRVRILMGSTQKMGAGMNVQTRLVALHHLDAPWRPSDIEQREGRILRQGNQLYDSGSISGVYIYRYVTSGSFDAYMWQTLEVKARFIEQVMKGDATIRQMEDLEGNSLSYAEVKALASGNPKVARKVVVDTEVRKLAMLRARWEGSLRDMEMEIAVLPGRIAKMRDNVEAHKRDLARRQDVNGENFKAIIFNQEYTDPVQMGEELLKAYPLIILRAPSHEFTEVGEIAGFKLGIIRDMGDALLAIQGEKTYTIKITVKTPQGMCKLVENLLGSLENHIVGTEANIDEREKRLRELKVQIEDGVWEHDAKFTALVEEQKQLIKELGLDKGEKNALDDAA